MSQKTIKIKSGDTLSKIAKASGTTVSAIASANKIKDVNKISVGQSLNIPSSSTSKVSSGSSSKMSSSQVKSLQESLNKKGANLVVDGIYGPKTASAEKQFSSRTSSPISKTSYAPVTSVEKKKTFGNPFQGGFFKNVKESLGYYGQKAPGAFQDAINEAYNIKQKIPSVAKNLASNALGALTPGGLAVASASNFISNEIDKRETNPLSPETIEAINTANKEAQKNSQNMNLLETNTINPDITGTGGLTKKLNETEPVSAVNNVNTVEQTQPQINSSTTESSITQPQTIAQTNPSILTSINDLNKMFVKTTNSWDSTYGKSKNKGEFEGSEKEVYESKLASMFTNLSDAYSQLNTPEAQNILKPYLEKGGSVADILSRVSTAKNQVTEPQTIDEYMNNLSNVNFQDKQEYERFINENTSGFKTELIRNDNVPSELKNIVDTYNKQQVMDSNYLTKYEKELWDSAWKEKEIAKTEIDRLSKLEDERETSIDRKKDIMIKRYRNEMKAQEAEVEQNRIIAKKNLTEFLGKIGALRTDGNAQLGIELLEQNYQAQKQAIRNKYELQIDDIDAEADEKISTLRDSLEKDKIDIMRDLSKSEREIRLEIAEKDYNFKKDILKLNSSYKEKLLDLKTNNAKDSKELSDKRLKWEIDFLQGGNSPEKAKLMAKDITSGSPSTETLQSAARLGEKKKENLYTFSKDDQTSLLKAGETSDSIAMLQSDISKYGVEKVYNDAGLDKETRKALKTIFGL